MAVHKFDRAKFEKTKTAKELINIARSQASPNNIPEVVERLDALEEFLGFNGDN